MKWFYKHIDLKAEPLNEVSIDCSSCTVAPGLVRSSEYSKTYKCCEFNPFWSAFAIGAWISEGGDFLSLIKGINEPVLTVMGMMHPLKIRQKEKSLCQYFNTLNSQCLIWHQRPATCSTFYCASGFKKGLKQYGLLEDLLLKAEADLLFLWFLECKLDLTLWPNWCLYMDKNTTLESLDKSLVLENSVVALDFYVSSFLWLKSQQKNNEISQNIKKQLEQISQLC